VDYVQDGRAVRAHAAREVIVSGGSYNSPQILMLSGIGPADHLREMGVTPIVDLPGVGANLQEHPNFLNVYRAKEKIGLTKYLRLDRATFEVSKWFAARTGAFATNGATANVFLRTRPGLDRPDAQLIAMPVNNSAELWAPPFQRPPYCFSVRLGALHPGSRGWVKLRSSDPAALPRIQFNMLTEPEDMATMVRALRVCREIYGASPLREMIAEEISPGAHLTSDADLAEAIRRDAGHRSHPIGTCRMGLGEDAVVDAQLRVRGVEGLRVADASIMPELPSGNTNIPTIMIGEKAADLIRGRAEARAQAA
ncbi:MAG TPA: GMC oxidoreductase, partial [Beijerinckiaceae bacterium]